MSVVVSDTSPLRALQYLGHLDWLHELFDHVFLPPAVAAELRRPPASYRPSHSIADELSTTLRTPVLPCLKHLTLEESPPSALHYVSLSSLFGHGVACNV